MMKIDGERERILRERLRRTPSPSSVAQSLPVLFFGDLFSARIVTIGLNPSDKEYTDNNGLLLSGPRQRFATLDSLHAADRASLTDAQCAEAVLFMRRYFDEGKPVYGWFAAHERVLSGFGVSFATGAAAHLDLVQEATRPTWSNLPPSERRDLLKKDLTFLEWQIRHFPIEIVVCTGKTVSAHLLQQFSVTTEAKGSMARIAWWVGSSEIEGRRVRFAGWNYPLARPTGLGRLGEHELGQLLQQTLKSS